VVWRVVAIPSKNLKKALDTKSFSRQNVRPRLKFYTQTMQPAPFQAIGCAYEVF
jgi:hypothetical protein